MSEPEQNIPCPLSGSPPTIDHSGSTDFVWCSNSLCYLHKCEGTMLLSQWNKRVSDEQPQPDMECKERDGCPTEKAVLQRFWREHQPTNRGATPLTERTLGGYPPRKLVTEQYAADCGLAPDETTNPDEAGFPRVESMGSPTRYTDGTYSREYEGKPEAAPLPERSVFAALCEEKFRLQELNIHWDVADVMKVIFPYLRQEGEPTPLTEVEKEAAVDALYSGYNNSPAPVGCP